MSRASFRTSRTRVDEVRIDLPQKLDAGSGVDARPDGGMHAVQRGRLDDEPKTIATRPGAGGLPRRVAVVLFEGMMRR